MSMWDALIEDLENEYGIETTVEHDEDGYTVIFKLAKPYEVGSQGFLITEEAQFVRMKQDVVNVIWRKYRSERIRCGRASKDSPYQGIRG